MVSIPSNYTLVARLSKLPFTNKPHCSRSLQPALFHKRRRAFCNAITALGPSPFDSRPQAPQQVQQPRTLFPGGFKRPEIKVPTLALRLSAEEVLRADDSKYEISVALSKGVGIVVLDGGDDNGARLYEAACVLNSVIGDRAFLLIAERVDIATAVGANGVLLSDKGIPTIVARNMMMKSRSDSVYLPIVARTVQTESSAENASSSEGADFLIIDNKREKYASVLEDSIAEQVKVPIFCNISDSRDENASFSMVSQLIQSGASGFIISFNDIKLLNDGFLNELLSREHVVDKILHDGYQNSSILEVHDVRHVLDEKRGFAGFTKIDEKEIRLIEEERVLLDEAVTVIRKAAPMMEEISLLTDAASQLDAPFLLVVVGEFNSGKSSVINAILGRKYLKEGVVPTTNEITLLCYSEVISTQQERCERHPDGQFICYLSAPILEEMNLVDTPGTNVILQRQQRLTEEFVPRADLVLFVISADRPLTESEVAFLLYVQQWKKKVVFVLNKADLYRTSSELEEAIAFIRENARKLLNTENIRLYPVSARFALEAKLHAYAYDPAKYDETLLNDPRWITSRFNELENFLFSLLDGSTAAGIERMRLKLGTPIGIADRLVASCERLVKNDYEKASQHLASIKDLVSSVKEYSVKMERESSLRRKQTLSLIEKAKTSAVKLIESTLQLSNIDLIATYAFKGDRSGLVPAISAVQNEILSPAVSDAQLLLVDYSTWLQSSAANEGESYIEYFKRWQDFINVEDQVPADTYDLLGKREELGVKLIQNFNPRAAGRLFEQEIREVVIGTFGGLGAAGLSASLLTSVLPTTLEDLLALAFCSTGGFFAISSFPARREAAIKKVQKVADALASEIDEAMQKDFLQTVANLSQFVDRVSKPYVDAVQFRINGLLEVEKELASVVQKLQSMKVEIQNLHIS